MGQLIEQGERTRQMPALLGLAASVILSPPLGSLAAFLAYIPGYPRALPAARLLGPPMRPVRARASLSLRRRTVVDLVALSMRRYVLQANRAGPTGGTRPHLCRRHPRAYRPHFWVAYASLSYFAQDKLQFVVLHRPRTTSRARNSDTHVVSPGRK